MHKSAAFMLFMHRSRNRQAPTRRSPVGPSPREGVGALQLVQLLIDTSVPPHPPQRPRGEAHEAERSGRARAGRAGQAGPTRQATAARGAQDIRAHEAGSSQPRAAQEPSHHGAQASSSRGTAGQQQQPRQSRAPSINRELFPAIHPPAHHIEHDAEPLAQRSPSKDTGNPSRATRIERRQGRQARGARSPATRARTTPTAGPANDTTRATPANHNTRVSSPPPIHAERPRAKDNQRQGRRPGAHQRPPEAAGATQGRQATRDSRPTAEASRRAHSSPAGAQQEPSANQPRQGAQKKEARRPRKAAGPQPVQCVRP